MNDDAAATLRKKKRSVAGNGVGGGDLFIQTGRIGGGFRKFGVDSGDDDNEESSVMYQGHFCKRCLAKNSPSQQTVENSPFHLPSNSDIFIQKGRRERRNAERRVPPLKNIIITDGTVKVTATTRREASAYDSKKSRKAEFIWG